MNGLASIFASYSFNFKPRPKPNLVALDNRSLFELRKWTQKQNIYAGFFVTKHGSWPGNIHRHADRYRVYIKKPPVDALKQHNKWICFHLRQHGWYEINLMISPRDKGDYTSEVSSIIAYVERLIVESFRITRKH